MKMNDKERDFVRYIQNRDIDTIELSELEYLLQIIKRLDNEQDKLEYNISASYFPAKMEVELTWECIETGKTAWLTAKVTQEDGERISEVLCPCVYHKAKWQPKKYLKSNNKKRNTF